MIYRVSKKDKVTCNWTMDLYDNQTSARVGYINAVGGLQYNEVVLAEMGTDENGQFVDVRVIDTFKGLNRKKCYFVYITRTSGSFGFGDFAEEPLSLAWYPTLNEAMDAYRVQVAYHADQSGEKPRGTKSSRCERLGGVTIARDMVYEDRLADCPIVRRYCRAKGLDLDEYVTAVRSEY